MEEPAAADDGDHCGVVGDDAVAGGDDVAVGDDGEDDDGETVLNCRSRWSQND